MTAQLIPLRAVAVSVSNHRNPLLLGIASLSRICSPRLHNLFHMVRHPLGGGV